MRGKRQRGRMHSAISGVWRRALKQCRRSTTAGVPARRALALSLPRACPRAVPSFL
jgi:hypothetical protein